MSEGENGEANSGREIVPSAWGVLIAFKVGALDPVSGAVTPFAAISSAFALFAPFSQLKKPPDLSAEGPTADHRLGGSPCNGCRLSSFVLAARQADSKGTFSSRSDCGLLYAVQTLACRH